MRTVASLRVAVKRSRRAFSLMEIMMATAILMGSAVVLTRLAGMGREQVLKADLHGRAQQLCEQTLSELLLGLRPMIAVESVPLEPLIDPVATGQEAGADSAEDVFPPADSSETGSSVEDTVPEWRHSVRIEPLQRCPGMWAITVELLQGDPTLKRPVRFSLTRWISGPPPPGAFDLLDRISGGPGTDGFSEAESFGGGRVP